eukprot:COSAG06_NODE_9925_length_1789_cov_1.328994_1_plen_191_part_00
MIFRHVSPALFVTLPDSQRARMAQSNPSIPQPATAACVKSWSACVVRACTDGGCEGAWCVRDRARADFAIRSRARAAAAQSSSSAVPRFEIPEIRTFVKRTVYPPWHRQRSHVSPPLPLLSAPLLSLSPSRLAPLASGSIRQSGGYPQLLTILCGGRYGLAGMQCGGSCTASAAHGRERLIDHLPLESVR